jgi:hypothetical protein
MTFFFLLLVSGMLELWALLFMWGFSAGPHNAIPFITLIGCITLLFVAAPLTLSVEWVRYLPFWEVFSYWPGLWALCWMNQYSRYRHSC